MAVDDDGPRDDRVSQSIEMGHVRKSFSEERRFHDARIGRVMLARRYLWSSEFKVTKQPADKHCAKGISPRLRRRLSIIRKSRRPFAPAITRHRSRSRRVVIRTRDALGGAQARDGSTSRASPSAAPSLSKSVRRPGDTIVHHLRRDPDSSVTGDYATIRSRGTMVWESRPPTRPPRIRHVMKYR